MAPAAPASARAPASREAVRASGPPAAPSLPPPGQIRPVPAVPTSALSFPTTAPDGPLPAPAYTGTIPMPAAPESAAPTIRPYSVVAPLPPPGAPAAAELPIGPSIPLPRPFPSKVLPSASATTAASAAAAPQARAPMPVNPLMTTGILDAPVEPGAIASEFAVDLGATATVELARARWNELRASQSPLFDNLKPVIALKDGGRSGQELHLVAGPLTNSATSARLCAVLAGTGTPCQPTAFEGQRLNAR